MSDLDRMIEDSLREADGRSPQLDLEPGYFAQALSLFTGRTAWVHWMIMIAQALMFVGGVICAVQFYQADAVMEALRWGLPSVVLLVFAAIFKTALGPRMETNRLLMEIKRVELRIERLRAERG
ncbi:DUF6768 family protein [Oceanicaulis sp.]|uniref:DUF6768 family protein n=1 Tax=Oceanicaulis sp. TaxID=1924941 RepID=UPI003BAA82B5